jgi:uncharacterized membrane protein
MSPPSESPRPPAAGRGGGGGGGGNNNGSATPVGGGNNSSRSIETSSLLGSGMGTGSGALDPERGGRGGHLHHHHGGLPSYSGGKSSGGGAGGGPSALRTASQTVAMAAAAAASQPRETCLGLLNSWFSRKFATGAAILLPIVVTFYVTFAFLRFFDSLFSPLWRHFLGVSVVGLGLATSVLFVLGTGIFFSSWLGTWALGVGEWIVMRLPLVKAIYSASKQISAALAPGGGGAGAGAADGHTRAFQECVIVRHPRNGSFAVGFVTARTTLHVPVGAAAGERGGGAGGGGAVGPLSAAVPHPPSSSSSASPSHLSRPQRLVSVYIPTNHVWVGDVLLISEEDVFPTQLTVRDGLECVLSVGMNLPPQLMGVNGVGGVGGGGGLGVGAAPAMLRD